MTASENVPASSLTVSVQDTDHADVKELISLTLATAEAYRNFYGNKKVRAVAEARKALQGIRVKTALMRKQIQADKLAMSTPKA
jgi:hypothetical protein